jgi:hypothetical protein
VDQARAGAPAQKDEAPAQESTAGAAGSSEPAQDGGGLSDDVFFTTSIQNGATVTGRDYEFTITHKKPALRVVSEQVRLNGLPVSQFRNRVLLAEGENTIDVTVLYRDELGGEVTPHPTASYTVYCDTSRVVITTSLDALFGGAAGQVFEYRKNDPVLAFTASARCGGEEAALTAALNGKRLGGHDGRFEATLAEGGIHTIALSASHGEKSAEKSFRIRFVNTTARLDTDLADQTVHAAAFTWRARVAPDTGSAEARVTVRLNGVTVVPGDDQGHFTEQLKLGRNVIDIRLLDRDSSPPADERFEYTVTFEHLLIDPYDPAGANYGKRPVVTIPGWPAEHPGNVLLADVLAADYGGGSIGPDGVSVTLNGQPQSYEAASGAAITFRFHLQAGENTVKVLARDAEGYAAEYTFVTQCTEAPAGAELGKVVISVEATTVGLGVLVGETEMPIQAGENGAHIVMALLEQSGFTFVGVGAADDGFYLSGITRAGLTAGWQVPDDLRAAIDADGLQWTDPPSGDTLAEGRICEGSGWMYQINGGTPGYGFSASFPRDGDRIRIRYTLAGGKDIGGGVGGGSYEKEW